MVDQFWKSINSKRDFSAKPYLGWKYSWKYYESQHGKEATLLFRRVVDALDDLTKKKGWDLDLAIRSKLHAGFYHGARRAFSVRWNSTSSADWNVTATVAEEEARDFEGQCWRFVSYKRQRYARFRPLHSTSREHIEELEPLLRHAYQWASGRL